jgi:hypothetical protein
VPAGRARWSGTHTRVTAAAARVALTPATTADSPPQSGAAHGPSERFDQRPAAPAEPRRRPIARLRNRIETTLGELTEGLGLARHRAETVWGLLTRAAATILAHTLALLAPV